MAQAPAAAPRRGRGKPLTVVQRDWIVMTFDRHSKPISIQKLSLIPIVPLILDDPGAGTEYAAVTTVLTEWPLRFPGEALPKRETVYYQVRKQRTHGTVQNR